MTKRLLAIFLTTMLALLGCIVGPTLIGTTTDGIKIYGKNAVIIGEVVAEHPGKVFMRTRIGGVRIVDMLTGEQLPRIC